MNGFRAYFYTASDGEHCDISPISEFDEEIELAPNDEEYEPWPWRSGGSRQAM